MTKERRAELRKYLGDPQGPKPVAIHALRELLDQLDIYEEALEEVLKVRSNVAVNSSVNHWMLKYEAIALNALNPMAEGGD